MTNTAYSKAEGITWISAASLIRLRTQASQLPLDSTKIHARQGGAYLSAFRGRGMEFDESRIYQAGDDIRNMDWRVTARTGNAHTKVFCEERERPVLLWLDLNRSMMFATRNKFKAVIATEIAGLIAWSTAANSDRVGGLIFSADEHLELKPRRGKKAVLDFIGRCTKHPAWATQTVTATGASGPQRSPRNMAAAVARLRKVTHPGSLIFMISDFREMDATAFAGIANIARNNDVVLISISDPLEAMLPETGSYRLSDGINELQINTSSTKNRDEYHQRYLEKTDFLQKFCRKNRIHLITLTTADNVLERLKQGLGSSNGGRPNSRGNTRLATPQQ